jgi:vacuolar-type H+-ATPase subunit H
MAKETVQAVRQAELNAAQIERDAIEKKDTLLSDAQQNAKMLVTSRTKEAFLKAERNLVLANEQGAQLLQSAILKADNEVLLLKEMVKGKEQVAIDKVLSSLI